MTTNKAAQHRLHSASIRGMLTASSIKPLHFSFLMQLSSTRYNSDCADIFVDALRGTATVMFKNSNEVYRYFNVSRRACFNFCNQPNISTGFWINANLFKSRVECFK